VFTKGLPKNLQDNLALLGKSVEFRKFYLAGGSALSLLLGHRLSVDLDFFTPQDFDSKSIQNSLMKTGSFSLDQIAENTLLGKLNGVKISFFTYRYPLLLKPKVFMGVKIASVEDIACMKLEAIGSRGVKRDFVDLYFIIKKIELGKIFKLFSKKYKKVHFNLQHLLKSLTYFEDAEGEKTPPMLTQVSWGEVKKFFVKEVKKLALTI